MTDDSDIVERLRREVSRSTPRHNHFTRWIAPPGQCSECDQMRDAWARAAQEGR